MISANMAYAARVSSQAPKVPVATFLDPVAPPTLWYANDVVWAIPSTGSSYPVAFSSTAAVTNYIGPSAWPYTGAYIPSPFTHDDAPMWTDDDAGGYLVTCTPTALPDWRTILHTWYGNGTGYYSRMGPLCTSLKAHSTLPSTNGDVVVPVKFVIIAFNTKEPRHVLFPME